MPGRHTPLALIYDFDGTLAPGNVQEGLFIPNVGMTNGEFWREVNRLSTEHQADSILMYMYFMLKKAREKRVPVRLSDFRELGNAVKLYQGVQEWFDQINAYSRSKGIRNDHFIVSSGNTEIIEGTPIAGKFTEIYASKFLFDENGVAEWPAQAVNYTTKTQFLFRINKGADDLSDNTKVNEFVKEEDRPVPFKNMVYFGDGDTDIPCFRLVKDLGGLSIAVFKPHTKGAREKAAGFLNDGRIHCVAPADYQDGSEFDKIVKAHIDYVAAREARTRQLAIV